MTAHRRRGVDRRPLAARAITALALAAAAPWASPPAEARPFVPLFQGELTAADGDALDYLGWSVALDGDVVVAGAPGDDPGGVHLAGSVVTFRRMGLVWREGPRIAAPDGERWDGFGRSVGIDGGTLAVGALHAGGAGGQPGTGAVYVFEERGGEWRVTAKLVPPNGTSDDEFGFAVALDGSTLAVGAPRTRGSTGAREGAVFVYRESGGEWRAEAVLRPSDTPGDGTFGHSISLAGDRLAVGAPKHDPGGLADAGVVYVLERDGTAWAERARLHASDGAAGDFFGVSVALDGDTIAIGAPLKAIADREYAGEAYVFERTPEGWHEAARMTAPAPGTISLFGFSIGLSGGDLVVGAPLLLVEGVVVGLGEVDAFTRVAGAWLGGVRLVPPVPDYGQFFGLSLAIHDGEVVGGAPVRAQEAGAAYVFGLPRIDAGVVVRSPAHTS